MARTFSSELKTTFNLGGELPSLAQSVEAKYAPNTSTMTPTAVNPPLHCTFKTVLTAFYYRKHDILTQRHELHELEAKLEATESELAKRGATVGSASTGSAGAGTGGQTTASMQQ